MSKSKAKDKDEAVTEDPPLPPMPWHIEFHPVGRPAQMRAFKVMPDGIKLYASMDDMRIWEHVQALARRLREVKPESIERPLAPNS